MFEVPKTMLTLTSDGLLFAGKHILVPLCPQTGEFDIETHLEPVMTKLSLAYMAPMDEKLAGKLRAAAKAWNQGDRGRAAMDLIYARLPEPMDPTTFCKRLDLVDEAFAAGAAPKEALKTFGMNMAWAGEARIPAGNGHESGRWTDGGASGNTIDVAARTKPFDYCAYKVGVAFVKKHQMEAATVAAQYGVPTHYVLGLSARETGYGVNSFMTGNAFFSLQKVLPIKDSPTDQDVARIPYSTGVQRAKQMKCDKMGRYCTYAWAYTYKNFTDSARSFLELYGEDVQKAKTPKEFLEKLQENGFNHADPDFTKPDVLTDVEQRMKCPS